MAKHMTLDERRSIVHCLDCGLTFAEMAGMFHRAPSTIANEVKNRMIRSNKGYGFYRVLSNRNLVDYSMFLGQVSE